MRKAVRYFSMAVLISFGLIYIIGTVAVHGPWPLVLTAVIVAAIFGAFA
jgi:hypothetical protein